jgi:hypothetical protein
MSETQGKTKHPRPPRGWQFFREVGPFPVYIDKETGEFMLLVGELWYGENLHRFTTIAQAQAWVDDRMRGDPVDVWSVTPHATGRMSKHTVVRDTKVGLFRDVNGGGAVHYCVTLTAEDVEALTAIAEEAAAIRERLGQLDADWQERVKALPIYLPQEA